MPIHPIPFLPPGWKSFQLAQPRHLAFFGNRSKNYDLFNCNQLTNQLIIMQIKYCYNFDTKEDASWLISVITDQHVNNRDNYEDVNCRSERWSLRQNQSQVAVTRWQFRCITEDHYINISCWPVQCARIKYNI